MALCGRRSVNARIIPTIAKIANTIEVQIHSEAGLRRYPNHGSVESASINAEIPVNLAELSSLFLSKGPM